MPSSGPAYHRLSAQDSSFVRFEGPETHMNVSAVAIFDTGPLANGSGGVDMERLRALVEARLPAEGGYRQRLGYTPLQRHPIWVDDPGFDLRRHLHHVSLPRPGSEAQLKDLAGRIVSQPLDRERPLWEMWVVEGLADERFAIVAKVHHSLVDGVAGVGLVQALLSPTPDPAPARPARFRPRPGPGTARLLLDEAGHALSAPLSAAAALGDALLHPRETTARAAQGAEAVWRTLQSGLHLPAPTPLNRRIGTQRRLEWCSLDLGEVRDLKKRVDGTVNDVVLAVVAGALRSFFRARRVKLAPTPLRVAVPVDMRGPRDAPHGNRVSILFVELPLAQRDPLRRFRAIRDQTRALKATPAADAIDLLHRWLDRSGSDLLSSVASRLLYGLRPHNLVVTNIPGPPVPLYLGGARLRALHPQLPLFRNQGLAVAALSYETALHFGLLADWELVPDLGRVMSGVPAAFAELRDAAERRQR